MVFYFDFLKSNKTIVIYQVSYYDWKMSLEIEGDLYKSRHINKLHH